MTQTAEILVRRVPDASAVWLEPGKRLMLAVLEHAVSDFRAYAAVPTGLDPGWIDAGG
jgi:hypothetical protein